MKPSFLYRSPSCASIPSPGARGLRGLPACLAAFALILVAICASALYLTRGHFTYPLDDSYIHMTIARNVATGDGFGINRGVFVSASSSPLWTFLLAAGFWAFGVRDLAPLALNALLAFAVLTGSFRLLHRRCTCARRASLTLWCLMLLTPLPALTFLGMEHVMHIGLVLWFCHLVAVTVSSGAGGCTTALFASSGLLVMARYEGLFLAGVATLLLILRRRPLSALAVVLGCSIPVLGFGLYSLNHGGYLLPSSVALKGYRPEVSLAGAGSFALSGLARTARSSHVCLLILLALLNVTFLRSKGRNTDQYAASIVWLLVGGTGLHMLFARTGWFFRYEAYLVALGCIAVLSPVALPASAPVGCVRETEPTPVVAWRSC